MVEDLQISFPRFANLTFALLRDRKGVSKNTYILVLISKKFSQKIKDFLDYLEQV